MITRLTETMIDLEGEALRPFHLELATGRVLRPSLPHDAPRLVAMFERCSPATRYGRFLSPVRHFPASHLIDVIRPSRVRRSWVVDDLGTGELVAVGSCFRNEPRAAEVGVLVEDDAQRQGIGSEILDTIATIAPVHGITTLAATALAQSRHVHRILERVGPTTISCTGPTCDLRVDLVPA
jgi:GNAT superfamily N-acetyltransferase